MTEASYVLVVDDEPSICWGFSQLLGDQGHTVVTASSAEEGLEKAAQHRYELVLLDVRLPGEDGISALPKFRDATDEAPIVVMTAFGDLKTAVGAVQQGATDYLTKPFRLEDAANTCRQAMRKRGAETDSSSPTTAADDIPANGALLVGRSHAMQQVFRQIALVADSDLAVLITGETGTGKALVAAAIHQNSRRSEQAYLTAAPVSMNESVIESELFGHVQGAFTGAGINRQGLVDLADGGSLVIDEIGDLPAAMQMKLLRLLEHNEFTPVGDTKPRSCNVRCIAVTNRDLHHAVHQGDFREDLLQRLSAVSIHLPPLRDRPDDIPQLCDYFLRRIGHSGASVAIDPNTLQQLQQRKWWGNVRELQTAIEHASVIAKGRPFDIGDFPEPQQRITQDNSSHDAFSDGSAVAVIESWTQSQLENAAGEVTDLHEKFLATVEPTLLRVVLDHTDGNRAAAAELLGIHRGTLRERLKRYGID